MLPATPSLRPPPFPAPPPLPPRAASPGASMLLMLIAGPLAWPPCTLFSCCSSLSSWKTRELFSVPRASSTVCFWISVSVSWCSRLSSSAWLLLLSVLLVSWGRGGEERRLSYTRAAQLCIYCPVRARSNRNLAHLILRHYNLFSRLFYPMRRTKRCITRSQNRQPNTADKVQRMYDWLEGHERKSSTQGSDSRCVTVWLQFKFAALAPHGAPAAPCSQ